GIPFIERLLSNSRRVVRLNNLERELLLGIERMHFPRWGASQEQVIISHHQRVRDAHQFPEHFRGRFVNSDKVTEALTHFPGPIQPFENREQKNNLLWQAFFFLEIAPD